MYELIERRPSSQPGTSLSRVKKRMAGEEYDLPSESLHDPPQKRVALNTRSCHLEPPREEAKAASTCKHPSEFVIRDLQSKPFRLCPVAH